MTKQQDLGLGPEIPKVGGQVMLVSKEWCPVDVFREVEGPIFHSAPDIDEITVKEFQTRTSTDLKE